MDLQLRPHHQVSLDRFVNACDADERILAALLVGSYVKRRDDEHSDLDFYLITKDEAHDDFVAGRETFVRQLGEPLFMEDFELPGIVFLIFPDGSEVEISYVRESEMHHVFNEPYKVILDKKNITTSSITREREVDQDGQREKLRRLIYWFWHEMSHFITALGRGQLWWAQGQLGALRNYCINLARLRNNFSDPDVGEEGYFKIENAVPAERLSPLRDTFCPMEKESMLKAGFVVVQFYKELALPLANEHGINYPKKLEILMTERLTRLQ